MATTGAIRRAKLQPNCHHERTNIQHFTGRMPFLLPNQHCKSTEGSNTEGIPLSRRRRRFRIDTEVRCVGAHPRFGPWSQRGSNPIKPVYDPDRPDGWLNLTASAFNQLGQYTSSPGRRGYCYAELAVFFPSGARNHRQYST